MPATPSDTATDRARFPGERWALFALLALVVVARIPFALQSDEGSIAVPIVDDGFYNLTIARNVATGRGFSFDGDTPTTGFHPLVVAATAPIFAIVSDRAEALRAIVLLYAGLSAILGWLLFRVVRRLGGPGPALTALLMYATGPATGIVVNTLNGCDTVFGGILLLALVGFYLSRVRNADTLPIARAVMLGILAGGLGWARLDLGLFAAVLGIDLAIVRFRRGRREPGPLIAFVAAGLLTIAPWFAFNVALTGRPLPDNGRAVTTISLATAAEEMKLSSDGMHGLVVALAGGGAPSGEPVVVPTGDHPPPGFRGTMTIHGALSLVHEAPVTGVVGAWIRQLLSWSRPLGLATWLHEHGAPLYGSILAAVALALLALTRGRRDGDGSLRWVIVASVLLFLAYPLVVFGSWFFGRYYFPLVLVTLLFTPLFARWLRLRRSPVTMLALVALFGGAFALESAPSLFRPQPRPFYRQAQLIATVLPPTAVVGALQSGHFAFFCPQRIINLDGKVSAAAHRAMTERTVLAYAREMGVEVITDWPPLIEWMVVRRSAGGSARLERIDPPAGDPARTNAHGWVSYRLAD